MLTLRIKDHAVRTPIEAECLTPDKLHDLSAAAIEKLQVYFGNRSEPLGEHFRVSGDPTDGQLTIEGDCSIVKWIGVGMTKGSIIVDGDVGMHLGSEMQGGMIEVRGNAGDWVGGEMVGGHIHVHGKAGHLIGAGYRGSKVGMRGGVILINGSAGNEIGGSMRRGLIAVGGGAGDFAGVGMIAGSIFLAGAVGIRHGANMKRGSIVVLDPQTEASSILPSFKQEGDASLLFLELYLRQLRHWRFPLDPAITGRTIFRRYRGDYLELGKGELLLRN